MVLKPKKQISSIESITLLEPKSLTVVCEVDPEDIHILTIQSDEVKRIVYRDGATDLCVYCEKHNRYQPIEKA